MNYNNIKIFETAMKEGTNVKAKLKKVLKRTVDVSSSSVPHRKGTINSLTDQQDVEQTSKNALTEKLVQKSKTFSKKIEHTAQALKQNWGYFYTQKLPFLKIGHFMKFRFSTYKKYLIPMSVGMLIVLIPVFWLTVRNPDKVLADWFDDNWHYRKTITISNSGAPDGDKKILFETDTATLISESKMQNNCADARFVDINGQVLRHYIDTAAGACNTNSTDFYILLPTINKGSTIIYFYYANTYIEGVAETSQFSQATFSPTGSSTGTETVGPQPAAYWKFDEAYDQKENTKIEQQLEIMNTSAAVSWLTGSTKRRAITVTNANASVLTNFQVAVNVTYDSDMNSDFSDIRFSDGTGSELTYWMEEKIDSTSAKFWIKVPTIAASTTTTIYLYYGNSGASSTSNGDATFAFFDDFSGAAVDTNKWTVLDATGITVSGGVLTATSTTGWLQSNSAFSKAQQPVIETKIQHTSMGTNGYAPLSTWLSTSDTFGGLIHPGSPFQLYYRNNGAWTSIYNSTLVSNLLVRLSIYSNSTAAIYYYNSDTDALVASATGISNSVDSEPIRFIRREDNTGTGQTINVSWDYVLVRSGATTEPTTSVDSNEFTEDSFYPTDASLGIVYFAPENYSSRTVYLEAVVSLDGGTTWATERTPEIQSISSRAASSYTVKVRQGNGSSLTPALSLYDVTNSESVYEYGFGSTSNVSLTVNAARLIIKQESGVGITQTETKTEVGSYETSSPDAYTQQTNKKIYNYDSSKYSPTPTNFFESTAETTIDAAQIVQTINISTKPFVSGIATYLPTDNSLGVAYWDADKYPGATVYLEVDFYESAGRPYIALYTAAGAYVAEWSLEVQGGTTYVKYRTGAISLTDNTAYTVRWKSADTNYGIHTLLASRFVVVQADTTKITDTETQVDIGSNETHTNSTYAQLDNPKTYYYDETKFNPDPTAYFEAVVETPKPTIEQQINISTKPFANGIATYLPTDGSLGIAYWDADKYPGATVYLEVDFYEDAGRPYIALYTAAGAYVTEWDLQMQDDTGYRRYRSGAVSLTDDTAYTVRWRSLYNDYGIHTLLAARFIVIQTDNTKIMDTEAQVDIGANEKHTNSAYAPLDNPKTYYYDETKFNPDPTAFFEATVETPKPTIEQTINITTKSISSEIATYAPTDSSLGIAYWDADKYPGATVYLEVDFYEAAGRPYIGLYAGGTYVTEWSLQVLDNTGYRRYRTGAISLTDNTDYSVRWRSADNYYGNHTLLAARFIVIQTDTTKITDTETQVELGVSETTTQTSYTNLTNKKVWNYDSASYTPTPTAYFEAVISNDTAGQNAYAALYTDGATCSSMVTGSDVSITGTTWTRVKSNSITLADDTDYTVCIKADANTAQIANARVILDQSDANGIRDTELYQMQVNYLVTDADSYSNTYRYTSFNPGISDVQSSFEGGTLSYYYEATLKTSAGTGRARLFNSSSGAAISNGEISTSSTAYTRVRTGDISSYMPTSTSGYSATPILDTQVANLTSNTTSVASSWVIIQVSNLSNTTNTVYAELYDLSGSSVSGSQVSTAAVQTTTRLRSPSVTLTTGREYVVRTKTSSTDGVPYYVYGAKIILDQSDANGIRDTELYQMQVNYLVTDADAYSNTYRYTSFNPGISDIQSSFEGGSFNYYYEATLKTSAGTGRARLFNSSSGAAISNGEISTSATAYTRVRTGDISSYMPTVTSGYSATPNLDTQVANLTSNTTSVANSWVIIQVSNLSNATNTVYAELYDLSGSSVSGSQVSTAAVQTTTRLRSPSVTLTTGREYVVRTKTSSTDGVPYYVYGAKIILDQSDANGIRDTELVYALNTSPYSDGDSTPSQINNFVVNPYPDMKGGNFSYFFESNIKNTAGTAYARLYNITTSAAITNAEVSTPSTSVTRVRSGDISTYIPTASNTLDVQLRTGGTGTTTSTGSSIIVQVHNLGDPEAYVALYPNGASCASQITGSEVTVKLSESIKRAVSQSLSLSNGDYMLCTKTPNGTNVTIYNAKINHYQSSSQGITTLRTSRSINTSLTTESTNTYVSKNALNDYDPTAFTGTVVGSFDTTMLATGSTAYAQLYNITGSEAVTGTEATTASTSYVRVQKSGITLPTSASVLDIQIKNGTTNTTKSTASWLVLDITNDIPAIAHDSTSNKINGQIDGPIWEVPQNCMSGTCLKFGGDGDYVKVTDNPRLDFGTSDSFTISMWFNQSSAATGARALLSKYESTGSDGGYQLSLGSDGKITVGISDDNTTFPKDFVTSAASYRDNKWHHVAMVKNGATSLSLYIDGTLEGTDSDFATAGALTNNDLLYIGYANDGVTGSWLGNLDDIKIYRYARTADEISNELAIAEATNSQTLSKNITEKIGNGLIGHWKLEEATTNSCATLGPMDACDDTANGYDAYWNGNASSAPGKIGNSTVLDGTGDALRVQQEWSRVKITFDNSDSAEDLTDFPVLVKVGSSRINYGNTQNLGQDIRFTDSDGTTLLNYEIEKWDEAGDSFVWVKVPNIPAGSTSDYMYMYYNDPDLSDAQNAAEVWTNSYTVVQHLPETSGTNTNDSTSNNNDGTKTSATEPNPLSTGQIDGSQTFDGSNDKIVFGTTNRPTNNFTYEAWFTADATHQIDTESNSGTLGIAGQKYLFYPTHGASNAGSGLSVGTNGASVYEHGDGYLPATAVYNGALPAGWNHIAVTYTNKQPKIYLNGALVKTGVTSARATVFPSNELGGGTYGFHDGNADEIRISSITRSADWLEATYLTTNDTFNTYGSEEPLVPDFNISDQLTISGWYYPTTLDNTTKFLLNGSGTSKSIYLKTDSANTGKLLFSTNGTDEGTSSTALTTNNWYFVTLTGNSTETKLYINGSLDSTVTNTTGVSDLETFIIGNNTSLSTNGFIGKVDEVKLYNTALASSDISTTYTSPKHPVAYYTFDQKDTNAVFDISTNNYPATWSGSTTSRYVTGKFGSAGVFDGSTDYASASDTPFDLTTDFTLESWINLGTAGSAPYNIISKHGAAGSGGYSLFVDANGAVNCLTDNGTSETLSKTANSAVTSSSGWIHVSAVREGTSCKVYVNSEDRTVTAGTHTTLTANDLNLRLGSNTSGAGFFKGYMDEVKIYDYAITPRALLMDYNAGHPIPGSPVGSAKGWWKMDEGYETTAHNTGSSGSANDGTITGAAWSQDGKYDRALDFDGSTDYVTVATGEIVDQNTVTIEAWIYPTSVTGAHDFTILAQNDNGAGYTTHNFGIAGSTGKLMYDNELPSGGVLSGDTVLAANQWQHVAVVRDADSVTFYYNGVSDGSGTGEARSSAASIDNTLIGARYYSGAAQHQFAGKLDDVKVYTVALSASQVAQTYNRGKAMTFGSLSTDTTGLPLNSAKSAYCVPGDATSCNAPVADYNFDEKQGSSLYDVSGNGHTGTLTNSPAWTNGNMGGALEFGVGDTYVNIATGELVAQDNITVEAWIYPGKVTDVSNLFTIYVQDDVPPADVAGKYTHLFAIDNSNGKLMYDNNTPTNGAINGNTALVANTWNHVAFSRSGNSVTFYLNGKADGSGTGETRQSAADVNNTLLGTKYHMDEETPGFYWYDKFIGKMSQVTIFDYPRTASQIAWDYNKGGPSLWWKLDECQGLVANDSSETGTYDGTITIGATGSYTSEGSCSGQSGEAWYAGASGMSNASLAFDDSNDYISGGTGPTVYAVSFWMDPATDDTEYIAQLDSTHYIEETNNCTLVAAGFSEPTVYVDGVQRNSLPNTGWHHVTVVTNTPFVSADLAIGKTPSGYYGGKIDEFKIFSYPLTATQIRNGYKDSSATFAPTPSSGSVGNCGGMAAP